MMSSSARLVDEDPTGDGFVPVVARSEIRNGEHRRYVVGGQQILLIGAGGKVFALANRCPHMTKPLEGGRVTGATFTCPFHGAQFDLETGRSCGFPKTKPAQTFEVRIDNGEIFVRLDRPKAG